MRREQLASILHARPFKPVKLFMSDGGTVEINHPEFCLLMQRTAVVGFPAPPEGDKGDTFTFVDLAHISRFVTETAPAADAEKGPDKNGS